MFDDKEVFLVVVVSALMVSTLTVVSICMDIAERKTVHRQCESLYRDSLHAAGLSSGTPELTYAVETLGSCARKGEVEKTCLNSALNVLANVNGPEQTRDARIVIGIANRMRQ
jgi:hypothetical protein